MWEGSMTLKAFREVLEGLHFPETGGNGKITRRKLADLLRPV
jgi:hypothetical protein